MLISILITCCGCKTSSTSGTSAECILARQDEQKTSRKELYVWVDSMPAYPGGRAKLLQRFVSKLKFDPDESVQFSYNLEFYIDKEGNVREVTIKGKDKEQYTPYDDQAINVMKTLNGWTPGKCKEQIVPVVMSLNIRL